MAQLKVQTEKIAFEQKRLSPSAKDIIEILSHSQIEMLKVLSLSGIYLVPLRPLAAAADDPTQTIESLVRELEHMKMTILLPPLDLVRLNNLLVEFSVLQRQLEVCAMRFSFSLSLMTVQLYHNELRHLMTGEPGRCFASLLIVKQPFPKTIKQHIKTSTAVDDPVRHSLPSLPRPSPFCCCVAEGERQVVVRLLIGARVEVRPITPCRAELIYEDYQAKRSEVVVQNDTQELGPVLPLCPRRVQPPSLGRSAADERPEPDGNVRGPTVPARHATEDRRPPVLRADPLDHRGWQRASLYRPFSLPLPLPLPRLIGRSPG
jgi:hypothetical protein